MNRWLMLGCGVLALGGYFCLKKIIQQEVLPEKNKIVQVLIKMRIQLFPLFFKISDEVMSKRQLILLTRQQRAQYFLQRSELSAEISNVKKKIIQQHIGDLNQSQLLKLIDEHYFADAEIKFHLQKLNSSLYGSIDGNTPALFIEQPVFAEAESVLQTTRLILLSFIEKQKKEPKQPKNMTSKELNQQFRQTRKTILERELRICRNHQKVYATLVDYYLRNPQFKDKYHKLRNQYVSQMQQIKQG